jgi:hypothetical protein
MAAVVAPNAWIATAYLLGYPLLRLVMAWIAGVWGVGDEILRKKLWLVPMRDAIHFVVWLAGFGSNRVKWGDVEYEIREGRMIVVPSRESI